MSITPQVECEQHHPTLSVGDVQSAVDFYTSKLGFSLGFTWGDPPGMAGVNLGEVSEEMLLHSFERVGNGVANPHSKDAFEYIQQLRMKHGIDYDAHATYRFVEH